MKLFRLIFILLGLYLCLNHVWCLTCETEYDDTASKAYFAEIVIIGRLSQKLPARFGYYNATVRVDGKRNVLKGSALVKNQVEMRGPKLLNVGVLGKEDPEKCIVELEKEMDYVMFLNSTSDNKYFRMSALPVAGKTKRDLKRAKKDIKKILCKKGNCAKAPVINPRKMKNRDLDEGDKLELTCRLKGRPFPKPIFLWEKDGVDISIASPDANIRNSKRGSRLQIRKARVSDAGTYSCIVKNVGGQVQHDAVITVAGSGERPEVGEPALEDVSQRFKTRLKLTCKVDKATNPKTRFKWFLGNNELQNGDRDGRLIIKSKSTESRLQINSILQSDAGVYVCVAQNKNGKVEQKSSVTVEGVESATTTAPQKKVPCSEQEKTYCLNNGTCTKLVELGKIFCTCKPGYRGERCMELIYNYEKAKEEKLAQDRTFVVVGIISAILLFIGICVVSYFLAKRRRDRFYKRRRNQPYSSIEDNNIPPGHRPQHICDDTDGLIKRNQNGVLIHKEVQTTETCFVNSGQPMYISAFEGYVNEAGDRHSRSRKPAVSIEGDPRTKSTGQDSDDENIDNKFEKMGAAPARRDRPGNTNKRHSNGLSNDGAPSENMNDLSPKRKPMQRENDRPVSSRPNVVNIPSPKGQQPPIINLDSDSEEDFPPTESLPALHISDGEDNDNTDYIFKKCKVKRPPEQKQENTAPTKDNNNGHDRNNSVPGSSSNTVKEPVNNNKPKPVVHEPAGNNKPSKHLGNIPVTSNNPNNDSDSSTTTEGCDSPNTALRNLQEDSSDQSPGETPRKTLWNERGSPEAAKKFENFFNIFPKMDSRHTGSSDRNRNDQGRGKLKNKYTIEI